MLTDDIETAERRDHGAHGAARAFGIGGVERDGAKPLAVTVDQAGELFRPLGYGHDAVSPRPAPPPRVREPVHESCR
jgi:hypothetical protein